MNVKSRLRNILFSKLQKLSTEKLIEIDSLLSNIQSQLKSKEKTLNLAGIWKDLNDSIIVEMTEKLHDNRANDRQIT